MLLHPPAQVGLGCSVVPGDELLGRTVIGYRLNFKAQGVKSALADSVCTIELALDDRFGSSGRKSALPRLAGFVNGSASLTNLYLLV